MLDCPALVDFLVTEAAPDSLASLVLLASKEFPDFKALPDGLDQPAASDLPDHRARLVSAEKEVIRDLPEVQDSRVRRVRQDLLDSLEMWVQPDCLAKSDFPDSREDLERQDLGVCRVFKELKDPWECKENKDSLEPLVSLVTAGLLDPLEGWVQQDNKVNVAIRDRLESLDLLELPDLPE